MLTFTVIFTFSTCGSQWKKFSGDLWLVLINNHPFAYLFVAPGKVAWGLLGKSISLNSDFACGIASLNFDSFDVNRKETR